MRSRAHSSDHEAAVARRLELLTAELAAVRSGSGDGATWVRGETDVAEAALGRADSWSPNGYTRIRAVPDPDEWPDDEADVGDPGAGAAHGVPPVRVPVPGRHAHRRFRGAWSAMVADAVPDTLRGRVGVGTGPLAVVAVIAAIGLGLTCWWLLRGESRQVAAPVAVSTPHGALATVTGAPSVGGGPSAARASPATKVVVDVAGKVRRPGIAVLHTGARIVDAIRAAGGARPGVDLSTLNLAQVLTDGQQIVVGGVATGPPASTPTGASPVGALVNLNTADETTLESLPEVGPVTALAIITWRTQHGGFSAVNQLLEVDGIGDATLAQLTPYVTL